MWNSCKLTISLRRTVYVLPLLKIKMITKTSLSSVVTLHWLWTKASTISIFQKQDKCFIDSDGQLDFHRKRFTQEKIWYKSKPFQAVIILFTYNFFHAKSKRLKYEKVNISKCKTINFNLYKKQIFVFSKYCSTCSLGISFPLMKTFFLKKL